MLVHLESIQRLHVKYIKLIVETGYPSTALQSSTKQAGQQSVAASPVSLHVNPPGTVR